MIEAVSASLVNGILSVLPIKTLVAVTIGVPIAIASINGLVVSLIKEEIMIGQQTVQTVCRGNPLQVFRSLLGLAKVFSLGMVMAAVVSLQTKLWILLALVFGIGCSALLAKAS